jgi:hypothetical protein
MHSAPVTIANLPLGKLLLHLRIFHKHREICCLA